LSSRSLLTRRAGIIEGLRADLAGVDDPVDRLTIYIRHQLHAGQQFHMGLGTQLYGRSFAGHDARHPDHVVAIEDVLREILADGAATGRFVIDDEVATMSLIHACLAPRELSVTVIERFVLRALGALRRRTSERGCATF